MATNPKAGRFNKQITFSTITKVDDGYGGFTATYAPYATVWAYIKPLSLNEQLIRGQESGTTIYDVWVINTGDYNFTRQMKVTYAGKEFVINSVVDQDEADRYFVFTMSAKDDITVVFPHLVSALTDIENRSPYLTVFYNFDTQLDGDTIDKSYFRITVNNESYSVPDSVELSPDLKSVIALHPTDEVLTGNALTCDITGGVIFSINGQPLATVESFYVQNNVQ